MTGRTITISDATFSRLAAFCRVAEAVMGQPAEPEQIADMVIQLGIESNLAQLWAGTDAAGLVEVLVKLAGPNPDLVYELTAKMVETGDEAKRAEARRTMGFAAGTE
ncbi:MAG TPA: hypothetical protein VD866_12655 [Urbifossiella sp.]|nr:hypothetical protein [Urbifossiella sp.]